MILPMTAIDALKVRNYLKKNEIKYFNLYQNSSFNKKTDKWVYTFQCAFETKQELEMFVRLCKLINAGIIDNT